jgi:hypothetical protein
VRWRIGDTDSSAKLQTDAEIDAALSEYGTKQEAAARVCDTVAAGYARKVDTAMGKLRVAHSQRVAYWRDLGRELRAEVATAVAPWAGGISRDDKRTREDDDDRVQPSFARGLHDTVEGQDAGANTSTGSGWIRT